MGGDAVALHPKSLASIIRKYFLIAFVIWTAVIAALFIWDAYKVRRFALKDAHSDALASYNKDVAFREWATTHGGVYVPVDETTPPNPYLTNVMERDVITPSGRHLTLMNPAYMARQMNEFFSHKGTVFGHITSLNLKNPINKPDKWEEDALKAFEKGEKERIEVADINGQPFLRLMRPMTTKEGCLKCHADQGYKVGDIRGGVAVSVGLAPYYAEAWALTRGHAVAYGLIWLLGSLGLLTGHGYTWRLGRARDETREALRKNEALLNQTQQISHVGGWEFDVASGKIQWTEETYRIYEVGADFDPNGISAAIKFHAPSDRAVIENSFKRAVEFGEPYDLELQFTGARGTPKWVRTSGQAERIDGKVARIFGNIMDVTGRKAAEDALRESEARWQFAIDGSNLGLWDWNTATNKVFFSSRWKSMLGYAEDEIGSDLSEWDKRVHPDDKAQCYADLEKHFRGEAPIYENEHRVRCKDGGYTWILDRGKVIEWRADGKPLRVIGTHMDITNRKATNEKLKAAKEEAEAATLLKDKFVSLVSHDLKAPLSSMIGFLKLMKNDAGEPLNEGAELILSSAIKSGSQMARLIDDLLSISRLRTGQMKLDRQFFDAKYLGIKMAADYSQLARQKGIEIENTIPDNSRIYGDKTLLTEAIQNLATNAIKFCKGGDRITISLAEDDVSTICVRDTGPGIKPDLLDNLFKYEKRTSTKGTAGETGTGFGLPLVKDIVEFHGGKLGITSEPGKGCLFSLKLPYVRPKILLVDDDKSFRYLQILNLKVMNATIIEADNGEEALNMLASVRPHLIITDIKMPIMDGLELLKTVRGRPDTKDIPVIVVSGEYGMEIRDTVFKLGADDFATKDIDTIDFIPRVRRFIG